MTAKSKYSLLVTDKDIHNLNTIFSFLEQVDGIEYNVMNASNAEMAVLIARKKQPELILLDWETILAAEFDIIKNLKTVKDTASIPVVLLTNDLQKYSELSKDYPCLLKPVNQTDLYECINDLLKSVVNRAASTSNYVTKQLQKEKELLENQLFNVKKEKELLAIDLEKISNENVILKDKLQISLQEYQKIVQQVKDISPANTNNNANNNAIEESNYYYALLEYILPAKILQNISSKQDLQVRLYENVFLLVIQFEDTGATLARLGSEKCAQEIKDCFENFDVIRKHYHLERIASLPHQYICSTHIQQFQQKEKNDILRFALEIRNVIEKYIQTKKLLDLPYLYFSLSLQKGELLAGKIGKKDIAYDIWGDVTQALPFDFEDKPSVLASEAFVQTIENMPFKQIGQITTQRKGLQKVYQLTV